MKNFNENIQYLTSKQKLSVSEKRKLEDSVFSFIAYHPIVQIGIASDTRKMAVSRLFTSRKSGLLFLSILLSITVTSIPALAEKALPGDVLYIVKTGINENIVAQFAVSPYEKVNYETKLIERRVNEARLLASEGKLTDAVSSQIAQTVKAHANAAEHGLNEMRERDETAATIASIAFDSALQIQSIVLDTSSSTSASAKQILNAVETVRDAGNASRTIATLPLSSLAAQVSIETKRANELLPTIKESATSEEIRNIERRLSVLSKKLYHVNNFVEENDERARPELMASLSLAQKLIAYMSDINIRNTVSLDTLAPVEDSSVDERIEDLKSEKDALMREIDILATGGTPSQVSDTDKDREKVLVELENEVARIQTEDLIDESSIEIEETKLQNAKKQFLQIHISTETGKKSIATTTATTTSSIPGEF